MQIVIFRHGDAEPSAIRDEYRNLTPRGRDEVELAVQRFKGFTPRLVAASPYVRAQQTAEIVLQTFSDASTQTWADLTPSGSCDSVAQQLEETGFDSVVLVSHQPLVSRLVRYFTSDNVSMGTASAVLIETEICKPAWGKVIWVTRG